MKTKPLSKQHTDKPARFVELEALPREEGQMLGSEKEPNLVAFANLINAKGITKNVEILKDGSVEIRFCRKGKIKRAFRLEPKPF